MSTVIQTDGEVPRQYLIVLVLAFGKASEVIVRCILIEQWRSKFV